MACGDLEKRLDNCEVITINTYSAARHNCKPSEFSDLVGELNCGDVLARIAPA